VKVLALRVFVFDGALFVRLTGQSANQMLLLSSIKRGSQMTAVSDAPDNSQLQQLKPKSNR
jgi:hypothetical protein